MAGRSPGSAGRSRKTRPDGIWDFAMASVTISLAESRPDADFAQPNSPVSVELTADQMTTTRASPPGVRHGRCVRKGERVAEKAPHWPKRRARPRNEPKAEDRHLGGERLAR